MSARLGWTFAATAVLCSGGCALIAGYDFGKYGETGGAGGAGGQASSSGVSSSGVSSSGATSSGATSSGASSTSSSTGSVTGSSSTSSTSSSSSATSSASSTTSSTGSGGLTVLLGKLLDPEAVAVDTQNVYYTTNDLPSGPSTAGTIDKATLSSSTVLGGLVGAPAVAAASSKGFVVTWVDASSPQSTVYSYGPDASAALGVVKNDTMLGVAVWGQTVFFTTTGSKAWTIPPGGSPASLSTSVEIASGPIAADASGVYWPTTISHMLATGLGGGNATVLCSLPAVVYGVATDASSVYWTDASGGVYQAAKNADGGAPKALYAPKSVPAYGIAVDPSDSTVYFALGSQVLRLTFPFIQAPTVLASGLVNPRGVAFDGSFVYVAEQGTGNPSAPDGRILKLAP